MGLDGDFLQWLQDNASEQSFIRNGIPNLMVDENNPELGTRLVLETVDLSSEVFRKSTTISRAYDWGLAFRRMILNIFENNVVQHGNVVNEIVVVLHSDGPYATLAKSSTQLTRKNDGERAIETRVTKAMGTSLDAVERGRRIAELKKRLEEEPIIPDNLMSPLEELWASKIVMRHHRAAAMRFLIDSVVKGLPGTTEAKPIRFPSDRCSLIVYPPNGSMTPPRIYTADTIVDGGAVFNDGGLVLGEGDFIGVQIALQIRRMQYCLAASEAADAAASEPHGWIRVHVNSNDSDLLAIYMMCNTVLDQQKIDVIINMGTKKSREELSDDQLAALGANERARVVVPPPPPVSGPGSKSARKRPYIERVFTLYVDVRNLAHSMRRVFSNPMGPHSISFMALISGSDLVPKKIIGGCGLYKALTILREEQLVLLKKATPATRLRWTPDRGMIALDSDGTARAVTTSDLPQLDRVAFDALLMMICKQSNKNFVAGAPLAMAVRDYNVSHEKLRGNQTIEEGLMLENSLRRGLYALYYYCMFGWNTNLRMDDPLRWGWKNGDASKGESALMPKLEE